MSFLNQFGVMLQTPEGQVLTLLSGLVFSIFGYAARVFFFPNPVEKRFLRYGGHTLRIVAPDRHGIPGFEVFVGGKKVSQVSVSHMAIWNHGKKPIRTADIAPSDPIHILAESGMELLSIDVIHLSRPACKMEVNRTEDSQKLAFTFDFLEWGDGAVVRIVHTANPVGSILKLKGTVIDGEPIKYWNFQRDGATKPGPFGFSTQQNFDTLLAYVGWTAIAMPVAWIAYTMQWRYGGIIMLAMLILLALLQLLLAQRWQRLFPGMPKNIAAHLALDSFSRPASAAPDAAKS